MQSSIAPTVLRRILLRKVLEIRSSVTFAVLACFHKNLVQPKGLGKAFRLRRFTVKTNEMCESFRQFSAVETAETPQYDLDGGYDELLKCAEQFL